MPQQTIIVSLKSSYQVFSFIIQSSAKQARKKTSAVILRNRRFTGITYQIRKSGSVMNHSINSTPIGKASQVAVIYKKIGFELA